MIKNEQQHPSRWPFYLSLVMVIAVVILYFTVPAVEAFFKKGYQVLSSENEQEISNWVGQFGWWGPMLLIVAMTAQMIMLVIPSVLVMVVSILAYGPLFGAGIILLGIFVASSIAYGLGSALGASFTEKFLGGKTTDKVTGFLDDYGFWAIFVVRFSPFLSNDAISLVAGIMKMGYWRFIGATILGIFPLTVLISYFGESINRLQTGLIWLGIISIIGFIGYVWWDKRRKQG